MAWRAADSLAVHSFLRIARDEAMPHHSAISRTRRLIDADTHREVFQLPRAVSRWIASSVPRPARQACLLNILAKLSVPSDGARGLGEPLVDAVKYVYFADVATYS